MKLPRTWRAVMVGTLLTGPAWGHSTLVVKALDDQGLPLTAADLLIYEAASNRVLIFPYRQTPTTLSLEPAVYRIYVSQHIDRADYRERLTSREMTVELADSAIEYLILSARRYESTVWEPAPEDLARMGLPLPEPFPRPLEAARDFRY